MGVEVIMPQMGESIFEGTITKWLKKPGDAIERDEPLFEISTDKVDAEIPSPAAGVLKEIRVEEGKTVPIQTVVALIDAAGIPAAQVRAHGLIRRVRRTCRKAKAQAPTAPPPPAAPPRRPQRAEPRPRLLNEAPRRLSASRRRRRLKTPAPEDERKRPFPPTANASAALLSCAGWRVKTTSISERSRHRRGGRISKKDVLAAISAAEQPAASAPKPRRRAPPSPAPEASPAPLRWKPLCPANASILAATKCSP